MSSDDGYIIRKHKNHYWLDWYSASADELPPVEKGSVYDTLEKAVIAYTQAPPSEYGLQIMLDDAKPDFNSFGLEPKLWANGYLDWTKRWSHYNDEELQVLEAWFRQALKAGVRKGQVPHAENSSGRV